MIDDDARLAALVREYLGKHEMDVTLAEDGERGLAALRRGRLAAGSAGEGGAGIVVALIRAIVALSAYPSACASSQRLTPSGSKPNEA